MVESNRVYLGTTPEHFEKVGMKKKPEIWEDGQRTPLDRRHFEWWYFDAELEDGSVIVIVFAPKPPFDTHFRIFPVATIEYTYPNGEKIRDFYIEKDWKRNYSSSKEKCDVQIGHNFFRGDLSSYEIYVRTKNIETTIKLENTSVPWRPGTGHLYFKTGQQEKYFSWLPSVPNGKVTGNITIKGETKNVTGRGYHDHNWGNEDPSSMFNHWYWSRSHVGNYTLLACDLIPRREFGVKRAPYIVLYENDRVVADDPTKVSIYRSSPIIHPKTKKFVNNELVFSYDDEKVKFQLKLERKQDIVLHTLQFMTSMHLFFKQLGRRPYYHRFLGNSILNLEIGNKQEEFKSTVLYELMYYGSNLRVENL